MKKKHPDCECHRIIDGRITCDLTCLKCSGAKKVITTEEDGVKKVEVIFGDEEI